MEVINKNNFLFSINHNTFKKSLLINETINIFKNCNTKMFLNNRFTKRLFRLFFLLTVR